MYTSPKSIFASDMHLFDGSFCSVKLIQSGMFPYCKILTTGHVLCPWYSLLVRVIVRVIPPRVVVSVAAQSFEPGSDIYTSDRGIVARNSVEYVVALESTLAFAPSFSRSRRVALRVSHTKQRSAGCGNGAAAVE